MLPSEQSMSELIETGNCPAAPLVVFLTVSQDRSVGLPCKQCQNTFGDEIFCSIVLETTGDGTRWLHLVHLPSAIAPILGDGNQEDEDEDEEKPPSQPSQNLPFSSSQEVK